MNDTNRKTRVGHCQKDDCDVYIGRGSGQRSMKDGEIGKRGWIGNPFVPEKNARQAHYDAESITVVGSLEESVAKFAVAMKARLETDPEFRSAVAELAGQDLGCFCQRLDEERPACHGEVIAHYAEQLG